MNRINIYLIMLLLLLTLVGCETFWDGLLLRDGDSNSTAETITDAARPLMPFPWDGVLGALVGGVSVWYTSKWRAAKASSK